MLHGTDLVDIPRAVGVVTSSNAAGILMRVAPYNE
jgi:hypothetical protein